jgi:hypothetical protein
MGLVCFSTSVYTFKNPPTKSLIYLSKCLCIAKRNIGILGKKIKRLAWKIFGNQASNLWILILCSLTSLLWTSWFTKLFVFLTPSSTAKEFLNSSLKKHRGCVVLLPRYRWGREAGSHWSPSCPSWSGRSLGPERSLLATGALQRFFGQIDQENSAVIFQFLLPVRGENVQETKLWGRLRENVARLYCLFLMRPLLNYAAALSATWQYCGEGG